MFTLTFDLFHFDEFFKSFRYEFDDTFTYDEAMKESFIIIKALTMREGGRISNIKFIWN